VPTLILHGEDDQIVPINNSAKKSAQLVKGAKSIFYPVKPHDLFSAYADQVNADLLEFVKSVHKARKAA
jgi:non-heme chloroperoxidase